MSKSLLIIMSTGDILMYSHITLSLAKHRQCGGGLNRLFIGVMSIHFNKVMIVVRNGSFSLTI